MPRRYITVAEQQQIIERANRREYCKSAMDYTSQPFVMEQFATQSVTDINQVTSLRTTINLEFEDRKLETEDDILSAAVALTL